jgi:hypothetical protein
MKNSAALHVRLWLMLRPFLASAWGVAFVITLLWQVIMLLLGAAAETALRQNDHKLNLLTHMHYWDGGWYLHILNGGYADPASPAPVFYPLFPLTVQIVQTVTFHAFDVLLAGLIVNTIALWLALVALIKIADIFVPGKKWWVVALFMAWPTAIFLHFFYSEAVFCAVAFWAYLFALRRQWVYMGLLLGIATAARLPALLFIGLCMLEFMRAHGWNIKKMLNPNLLLFLLVPLGFVAYGLYLYVVRGDFFAMFTSYSLTNEWTYHQFNPNIPETIWREIVIMWQHTVGDIPFNKVIIVYSVLPVVGLFILLLTSLYAIFTIRDKTLPLGIFGLASIVFFTINNNTVSVHRYLLPCLTIYVVGAILVQRHKQLRLPLRIAVGVGVLLQAYLLALFVSQRFAG